MPEALRFDIFAKDEFSKNFKKLTSILPSIKTLALGAAAGVSAIGISLFAMAKTTATAYDKIGKFAQQTGLTTEFLSKMNVAANFADVNINTMNKSLEKLQIGIGEAGRGIGLARETLEGMDIALHQANGKMHTAESILPLLADKFQDMTDATIKSEAAQKLFGQRGIEMIKILNDGSEGLKEYADEAEAMGLVVSEKAAKNAADFNDALFRVKGSLTGLKNEIGERTMPYITKLSEKFADFVKDNRPEITNFGLVFVGIMGQMGIAAAETAAVAIDAWQELRIMWAKMEVVATSAALRQEGVHGGISKKAKQRREQEGKEVEKLYTIYRELESRRTQEYNASLEKRISDSRNVYQQEASAYDEKMGKFLTADKDHADAVIKLDELQKNQFGAREAMDEYIEKIGAAIEAVTLLGETEVETNEKVAASTKKKTDDIVKYDMTAREAQLASLNKLHSVGKALGKEWFFISQVAGVAHAWMNTAEAATKALTAAPPPWNFALAAATWAAGAAQVATITSQKYAAHGGMTNVPKEQTMLINKNERILSPNQNKDFTDFITKGGGGGSVTIENMNILPNATNAEMLLEMGQDVWEEIVEINILPALKNLNNSGLAVA